MKKIVFALVISLIIPAFAGATIQDMQVSNNTSAAVTISWITDSDSMGEVHYSENPDLSNPFTDYDVRGQTFEGCTHYVDITNLNKKTTYYFEVVSGGEIDNNNGSYYTFKTMEEPFAPPGICLLYGDVYQEDGSTSAEDAIVYLWLTHSGVDSYLLSKLIGAKGSFLFNVKEARSVATDNVFSYINTGNSIYLKAVYCGDHTADKDLVFESCTYNCGSMTLVYFPPTTTTSTATLTTTSTTTSLRPTTTSTSIKSSTSTTTIESSTTTTLIPTPECEVTINPTSKNVLPGATLQFSASTSCDGEVVTGEYVWDVDSTIDSSIDEKSGLYKTGTVAGTDRVMVKDTANWDTEATVEVVVSPLWPMAYDKMWGAKKGENIYLLRTFRDEVLADSEVGGDYIFMLYNNSLEILILLFRNPSLTRETKEIIDELLPGIQLLLDGGEMVLSRNQLAAIKSLLTRFDTKASPELNIVIRKVRRDIEREEIFKQFGIAVHE